MDTISSQNYDFRTNDNLKLISDATIFTNVGVSKNNLFFGSGGERAEDFVNL